VTCKQDKDKWSDENEYEQCEVCSMIDYFNQEEVSDELSPKV
jgi:hypothetical protein